MATTELDQLNPKHQVQHNIVVAQQIPPKQAKVKVGGAKLPYDVLFKKKLKENDGCCTSWCGAHFFLIYLLLNNVAEIALAAYHIVVLQSDDGEYEICNTPSTGGAEICTPAKAYYEDQGLTVGFLATVIAFCGIHLITNVACFIALQKCIPWIFFLQWILLNVAVIFILMHSIFTGIYWGIFALLIPMMLACYFWMLYQLAKYFVKGGVYDSDMNYVSPAPNNYAVVYVAKPDELALYHQNKTEFEKPGPDYYKKLFSVKMHERFDTCCCQCNLMTWSIIWIVYMLFQNSLWLIASIMTTIVLYEDYGTYMDCETYTGVWVNDGGVWFTTLPPGSMLDCRTVFEDAGLTKGFSIVICIVAGISLIVNGWCLHGLYTCNTTAILTQVWMLLIQGFFMLLFAIFTTYYFGFFALLIPLLLSCHFYSVYVLGIYCKEAINVKRFPRMEAQVVYKDKPQPPPPRPVPVARQQQPNIVYVQQLPQSQAGQQQTKVVYVQPPVNLPPQTK